MHTVVIVNPLKWEELTQNPFGDRKPMLSWVAQTPVFEYQIKTKGDKFVAWNQEGETFDTLDDAKKWFQEEVWEPLIKSCVSGKSLVETGVVPSSADIEAAITDIIRDCLRAGVSPMQLYFDIARATDELASGLYADDALA